MREKTKLNREEGRVASSDFINKTQEIVNFLTHVYSLDTTLVISIIGAQANGDKESLISFLESIRDFTEIQIAKLNEL